MPVKPDFKFEKVKDSVSGDKAWVTFKDKGGNEETLELSKVDGKWLVDMQPKK